MPSIGQVEYHYQKLREMGQAQTAEQIRMAQEQAALQAQRDAQLSAQQQEQLNQQAQLQAQRDQQLAGYQAGQQVLQGQIGSARDYQQFRQQGALAGQQYEYQYSRDQQQAGFRAQEQERQASLAAQLSQVQLTQREEMDRRRMEAAAGEVDQKVRAGSLTPEEGANLQMQIRTGLNPLQNRATQAEILRSQVQTQALEQQNQHQAMLFSQRQERLAAGAAGNIQNVWNPDTQRYDRYMVDINTGQLSPLESSTLEQARQLHLLQAGQSMQQSAAMFPGQLQAQQAGIAQTQAATAATNQQTQFSAQLQPGRIEEQFLSLQGEGQRQQFLSQLQPLQLQQMQASIANSVTAGQAQIQEMAARREEIPLQMMARQVQLAMANEQLRQAPQAFGTQQNLDQARIQMLQQQVAQGPQAFQTQQQYEQARISLLNQQVQQGPQAFQSQQAFERARTQLLEQQVAQGPSAFANQQAFERARTNLAELQGQQMQRELQNGLTPRQMQRLDETTRREVATEFANPLSEFGRQAQPQPNETPEQTLARVNRLRDAEIQRRMSATMQRLGVNQNNEGSADQATTLQQLLSQLQQPNSSAGPSLLATPTEQERTQQSLHQSISYQTPVEQISGLRTRAAQAYNGMSVLTTPNATFQGVGHVADILIRADEAGRPLTHAEAASIRQTLSGLPAEIRQRILGQ